MVLSKLTLIGCALSFSVFFSPSSVRAESMWAKNVPDLPSAETFLPAASRVNRIELSLSQRYVKLYEGDRVLKQYPVAVGKPGWETPVGQFKIQSKIVDPAWRHPLEGSIIPARDPQNPLGRRWMGFWTDGKNMIGFHGTADFMRPSIGRAASHGCVRMFSEDIEAMFEMVAVGTPVIVTP